jgi:hypothetical protein
MNSVASADPPHPITIADAQPARVNRRIWARYLIRIGATASVRIPCS